MNQNVIVWLAVQLARLLVRAAIAFWYWLWLLNRPRRNDWRTLS